jgi:uncharacterized membrane protein YgcG
VTTMEVKNISKTSGAPTVRSMATSLVLHVFVLVVVLLIPAQVLLRSEAPNKELDIVFYRPAETPVNARALSRLTPPGTIEAGSPPGAPAPALKPKPNAPPGPNLPGKAELPPGPEMGFPVEPKPESNVGKAGILALKEKFASLAQDTVVVPLGADARHVAADDVGRPSSRSMLTSNAPGSSGGINLASLSRSVGGGGGGGGGGGNGVGADGGGGGGIGGVGVGRAVSPITPITGADRPKARSGPGPSRTDEEIQIVFDRYKASFYRLYNRELRNNPALKGQMVLRLTIEPDGSVSMCALVSTDMDAPDLATQVVGRVRTINFGAKEGVQAVTIVYPIDFLPAA